MKPNLISVHAISAVTRSIGEKDAPCQKQNGTFRDASWCGCGRGASAEHDATAQAAQYTLCDLPASWRVSGAAQAGVARRRATSLHAWLAARRSMLLVPCSGWLALPLVTLAH